MPCACKRVHYARTPELHDHARSRSDAQLSSQPLPLTTVDPAMESSFDGLSAAAEHVRHLLLPLAQHRDKVQQVNGGVAHRLQTASCWAG